MLTLKLGISNTWHLHSRNRQHSGHLSLCPELPCAPGKPLKRTTCRRPRDLLFESLHLHAASLRKTPLSWSCPNPPPCKVLVTHLDRFAYLTRGVGDVIVPFNQNANRPSLLAWLACDYVFGSVSGLRGRSLGLVKDSPSCRGCAVVVCAPTKSGRSYGIPLDG